MKVPGIQVYNVHVSVYCTSGSQVELNGCKLVLEVRLIFRPFTLGCAWLSLSLEVLKHLYICPVYNIPSRQLYSSWLSLLANENIHVSVGNVNMSLLYCFYVKFLGKCPNILQRFKFKFKEFPLEIIRYNLKWNVK